uniref:Uncharacterized protein n=1 Tax=Anguilla anguilla TaxID=7936 RepID=A0A0E9SM48_ANGAN
MSYCVPATSSAQSPCTSWGSECVLLWGTEHSKGSGCWRRLGRGLLSCLSLSSIHRGYTAEAGRGINGKNQCLKLAKPIL